MAQRSMTKIILSSSAIFVLLCLEVILGLGLGHAQAAQIFSDVPDTHPQSAYINNLATAGIVVRATRFHPDDSISRAELLKMVMGGAGHALVTLSSAPTFVDVKSENSFFPWIETAVRMNFVHGYRDQFGRLNWLFKPWSKVTRAEAIKMAVSGFELSFPQGANSPHFSDVPTNSPFYTFISIAGASGMLLSQSNQSLKPNEEISRAEVAKLVSIARALQQGLVPPAGPSSNGPNVTPVQTDIQIGLTLNVNSDRPIVAGENNALLLALDFIPRSQRGILLRKIVFARSGLGNREDFSELNLFVNGDRVAGPRTLTSDNKASFLMNVFPPELLSSGTSSVELRGTLKPGAASPTEHIFSLSSIEDLIAEPKSSNDAAPVGINASFPVVGGKLRVISSAISALKINTSPAKTGSNTYRLGDNGVPMLNISMVVEGEDIIISSIVITSDSVYGEIANLEIIDTRSGMPLGNRVPLLSNNKASFDFSHEASGGIQLSNGVARSLVLKGDLSPNDVGRIGQTIAADQIGLKINSGADVIARTKIANLGVRVQINS